VTATISPKTAATLDKGLLASTIATAHRFAAELAVFKPMRATQPLTANLAAEQSDNEAESDQTWERLIDAWNRTIVE
jgi:hypothetical protein